MDRDDDRQVWPAESRPMPAWASGRRRTRPARRWPPILRSLMVALVLVGVAAALGMLASSSEPPHDPGRPLTGQAERVVDGDTLDIAGQRVRLSGLDAPEYDQLCRAEAGTDWPCGVAATKRLRQLAGRGTLVCTPEGHDRYGRLVALCRAGATDLAEAMVGEGLAVATTRYRAAEARARAAGSGIWQGAFIPPAEWRRNGGESGGNPSRFERFLAWLQGLLDS